jgi:hypothetical protein
MITQEEKTGIQTRLQSYCNQKGSQNKAANSLKGVSSALVSRLLKGEWELISEEMWRNISNQIGSGKKRWEIVETRNYKDLMKIFSDAQEESMSIALCAGTGNGKTLTARIYTEEKREVFHVVCRDYWNRKWFLQELLREMGRSSTSENLFDMMNEIVHTLKRMNHPLIILDEADKMSDSVLYFFITLYNELEESCGLVMMATDYLEKRMKRGLRLNKKGFQEVYSRIGKNFIRLRGLNANDITEVCISNGIDMKEEIKDIYKDCDSDLRRVKRKIFAIKRMKEEELKD